VTAQEKQRRFGRDSRLRAWTVAHPLRFGASSGAIMAAVFAIGSLPWKHGAFRALASAAAFGVVWAVVFGLATKATP
jgi:hypothetical protein